ncbi:exonuclease domain-containing protein [Mesobacillus maritimus]|uniref:exonuclease domain-containing protein n=1 Tax=Mesobacillus maritimus TaxID=1643336 RepID=UPI00203CAA69|nr:exonuclease domain-containing protein [Mesobacillus maritimus]MCM3667911.1 exonuclease domain-containing protein [Mesobacillus maritimus]
MYDYEPYVDGKNEVKKRRAYVWRFVGFGRSCFAPSKEELKKKVQELIDGYKEDSEGYGYNAYPYYTRYYRNQKNRTDEMEGMKLDFISIDFEIANENLNSACSMGIVFVEINEIVDRKHFYIQPPVLEFDSKMVDIHGITPEHVKGARKFYEIWEEIKNVFKGSIPVIAHNAQFDMSVLYACLNEYNLPFPDFTYIDSIPISTRACRGENVGNSLKERISYFGIPLDNHHDALSDALATAQLVLHCIKLQHRNSLQSYCRTYSSIPVRSFYELKPNKTFGKRGKFFKKVSINEIAATVETFHPTHILFSKNVVFTGELQSINRKEAMQKVVDLGGILKFGVSKKTNYLVVGKQDKTLVGEDGLSTKEKKHMHSLNKVSI